MPGSVDQDLDRLNNGAMAMRSREPRITGHKRSVQRLGEGDIHGIVGGERGSQLPSTYDQIRVGVTLDAYSLKIMDGLDRTVLRQIATQCQPAQCLSHLNINQMRRMQASGTREQEFIQSASLRRSQEQLEHR